MFIDDIHAYISNEQNSVPLSDRFWASGSKAGQAAQGVKDRPTVAGHWASLALERLTNSGQTMSWIQPKNPPLREKRSAAVSARLGGSIRWNCVCNILVGLSIWISVIWDSKGIGYGEVGHGIIKAWCLYPGSLLDGWRSYGGLAFRRIRIVIVASMKCMEFYLCSIMSALRSSRPLKSCETHPILIIVRDRYYLFGWG